MIDGSDVLGILDLPHAGTVDRAPIDVLRAAHLWTTNEALALAKEICPRCSATLDVSVLACGEHEDSEASCEASGQRFAIVLEYDCTNCIFSVKSTIGTYLFDHPTLFEFMICHDIDPFEVPGFHFQALEETVRSADPLDADLTFTTNGESITFRGDDRLSIQDISGTDGQETV